MPGSMPRRTMTWSSLSDQVRGAVIHIPGVVPLAAGARLALDGPRSQAICTQCRAAPLNDYLQRNNIPGHVTEEQGLLGFWTIRREITRPGKVTIVIPVPADPGELHRCLASLAARTAYVPYEILLVAPGQLAPAMSDYLARTPYRVIHVAGAPTIPHLLNQAAREADGEYLLLLDSACEALAPSWLAALVEHGQRPEVGAVGAKLLDAAGRIQHAGFILGLHGLASSSHYGHDGYIDPGYLGFLRFTRNYSAISGACMLIRRELFLALGGFNEQELALAGSDLDLCLRLRRHGYLIVFTPRALLRRHRAEDPAPGAIDPGAEVYLRRTWADILADDPYYNPNQTREGPGFAVDFDKLEGTRYLYTSPPGATTINLLGVGRTV